MSHIQPTAVPADGTEANLLRAGRFLYVFLDEGGNFDFSPNGTRYWLLSSLTRERPFHACKELIDVKYDFVETGADLEFFHASEDRQAVRNAVFPIIAKHLDGVRIDSLIVEKRKTNARLRPPEKFYPMMLGSLLGKVLGQVNLTDFHEVLVFTDTIPVSRQRNAVEKAIKTTLAVALPAGTRFRMYHHESKSNIDLQIADYCNWAIYRKWTNADERSYNLIRSAVRSEFDIFSNNLHRYY